MEMIQWIGLFAAGLLLGINRAGLPGLGVLIVPLMAITFPAKASTGILLPLLIFSDFFAIIYHRRNAQWNHILRLLPATLAGLAIGMLLLNTLKDTHIGPIIGCVILMMLGISAWLNRTHQKGSTVPSHWSLAAGFGLFAGITTHLANAAGPVATVYFLTMKLDKKKFVGTFVWFFCILNWIKLPLFMYEGRVDTASIMIDLAGIPFILVGIGIGVFVLKRIPQRWFTIIIQLLATAGAIKLIFGFFIN